MIPNTLGEIGVFITYFGIISWDIIVFTMPLWSSVLS